MSVPVRRCAIAAASSAAMLLAAAAPALAATAHHKGLPTSHTPAMVQHFNVHGLVLAVDGNQVKVLSTLAHIGTKAGRNQLLTLTLTPTTKTAKARTRPSLGRHYRAGTARYTALSSAPAAPVLAVGQDIVGVGTVASDGTLVTAAETSTVLPSEALVGTVSTVAADGLSFTVASHDQVDGDHAEQDTQEGMLVSAQTATVTGPAVTSGDYVVVLGEADGQNMLAAKIYTFATPPTLAAGQVSTADPSAKTFTIDAPGDKPGGQDPSDTQDNTPSVNVDASSADIIVNGTTPGSAPTTDTTAAPAAFPAAGDQVLTVGTPGASPDSLTASLVFDFNPAGNASVQDNQHNDDHRGNGQD